MGLPNLMIYVSPAHAYTCSVPILSHFILLRAQSKDIARASWEVFGKFGHLRLFLRNGKSLRYDGFSRGQFDKLKVNIHMTNGNEREERQGVNGPESQGRIVGLMRKKTGWKDSLRGLKREAGVGERGSMHWLGSHMIPSSTCVKIRGGGMREMFLRCSSCLRVWVCRRFWAGMGWS